MKILLLLSFLFLGSCSSITMLSKIDDPKKDLLKEESLLRYSVNRLKKIDSKNSANKSLVLCHQNNTKVGLRGLKKETLKKDKNHNIWNNIGTCYYLKDNLIKSEFYFQYSLNISKKNKVINPYAYNNLGLIAIRNRNFYLARDYFKKSLKDSPHLLTPKYNLAQLNLQFSQVQEAQKILLSLYKINPQDKDIISSLGTSYLLLSDYNKAIHYYKKIDSNSIRRTDIALHFSLALFETGKYEEANEILKVSNRSKSNYINLSRTKLQSLIDEKIKSIKKEKTNFKKITELTHEEKRG